MLTTFVIGFLMLVITTAVHSACMVVTMKYIMVYAQRHVAHHSVLHRLFIVAASIFLMFFAAILESMAWAAAYLKLGALKGFEAALYFSTVTYTTLGYGEIVLSEQWRLLASFQAAIGIIMFGWTTALVVAVVQKAYTPSPKS